MTLMEALNARIGSTEGVVPVTPIEPEHTALPSVGANPAAVRPILPGEVGTRTMKMYPEIEYNRENLVAILTRANKGTAYLLENLDTSAGSEQLGLLCEILEGAQCMVIAHMASGILNA